MEEYESPFHSIDSDYDPIVIAAQRERHRDFHIEDEEDAATKQETDDSNPQQVINIIALGRTGDGKSSLLNDMLGENAFKHKRAVQSQTAEIQEQVGFWAPLSPHMPGKANFGCHIRAIDTPGFGDSQLRDEKFLPAIRKKMIQVAAEEDGLHCILLVFKVTANADIVLNGLRTLRDLLKPADTFWDNVILVFTHADASSTHLYRGNKVALKTKLGPSIKEQFSLEQELPMVFISTQKYMCSFLKGLGDCDCVKGFRYHADCRRRFYEHVWKRRNKPFRIDPNTLSVDDEGTIQELSV